MKHLRRLAVFHSSRRDTSKATPGAQSAMYCRKYQLAQPECHSRGRPAYQYVDQEAVAKSLSYRTLPINGFDGLDTVFCGHCQQLSKVSHSNICLAVAGNKAAGVEAELLRIALAKSQLLPELHGTIPCSGMINNCVHSQLGLKNNPANFLGRSVRSVQMPRSTRSRPK